MSALERIGDLLRAAHLDSALTSPEAIRSIVSERRRATGIASDPRRRTRNRARANQWVYGLHPCRVNGVTVIGDYKDKGAHGFSIQARSWKAAMAVLSMPMERCRMSDARPNSLTASPDALALLVSVVIASEICVAPDD